MNKINLGSMAPPLVEQLRGYHIEDFEIDNLQQLANGISRLAVHGILTAKERDRARDRLVARIREVIEVKP